MKMRKELNNKGFSLVELLIATVILAIIVAPLLHSFVTAANTTVKSRQMGDVTLASENIAEAVEAAPLTELLSSGVSASKYFAGATGKSLYSYDGSTYTEITNPSTANCYYLGVQGVKAGSSTFNAMIKLDANEYRNGSSGINDVDLTDYSNMDAVYAQGMVASNPDDLSLADFRTQVASYPNYRYSDPIRTITLEVKEGVDEDGDPTGKIHALLYFDYEYTVHYELEDDEGNPVPYTVTIETEQLPEDLLTQGYDPALNGGRLPNIYVMYNPLYGDRGETNDIIRIENKIQQPFKVFLVKERGANLSEDNHYAASVAQYVPTGTDPEDCAIIYSNINENLNTGTELSTVNYRIFTGNYFSRQGYFAGEHGDLVSKTDRNRMFEVTVQLFDAADTTFTTPLHTFRSTKLQ